MTERLDLPRRYRDQIEALLREHVPGVEVWAYGSRVTGKSHKGSDLDLVAQRAGLEADTRWSTDGSELRRWRSRTSLSLCRRTIGRGCRRAFTGRSSGSLCGVMLVEGEWVPKSLSDLIDIRHGFAFKEAFIREEECGDILLTPGNFAIGGGFKDNKFKYYDSSIPEEFILSSGDLLVTMTDLSKQADTLGYPAVVPKCPEGRRYLHNQRLGGSRDQR